MKEQAREQWVMNLRRVWLILALGLFLGLAAYQLGLPGLHYDEAKEAGVNAMELLTGAPITAYRGAALRALGRDWPLMVQDYIGALNVYLALPFLALTGIGVPNLRMEALFLAVLALLSLERVVSEWWALQKPFDTAKKSFETAKTQRTQRAQRKEDICVRSQRSSASRFLYLGAYSVHKVCVFFRRLIHSPNSAAPISLAGLLAVSLLAAAPSFVFWNRQGVFVTNATLPFTYGALWQALVWVRTGRGRHLVLAAFGAGCALYAKLLAVWILGPAGLLLGAWLLGRKLRPAQVVDPNALHAPLLSPRLALATLAAGLLPLLPFLFFNLQTQGTLQRVTGNLTRSYYGVNNLDLLGNLPVRLGQVVTVLRGDHFWYLGGLHANGAAPWLAGAMILAAFLWGGRRLLGLPLLLLATGVIASLFTVSDLFITHYALLHPLLAGLVALAGAHLWTERPPARSILQQVRPWLLSGALVVWLLLDLSASLAYHRDLSRSGGLADHSDASYHLAYHLRYNGLGAPIVLDWGMEATVRYLTAGTVRPIEIFGYERLDAPDDGFALRLGMFLENPDNVYLLRAPGSEVFQGRREAFFTQAQLTGRTPHLERTFTQRDGTPLFELWRVQ